MKIGFDVSDLSTNRADGTTRYTHELAKRLPRLDTNVQWVFFAPALSDALREVTENVSNVTLSITPWPKYWTQLRLPFDIYTHKIDTLLMPIQQLPYIRPKGVRAVAVVHDLAVHRFPKQFTLKDWALLHVFSAYAVREADAIIAVSKATADDVADYYKRTTNVHVIHHGVDHEKFHVPSEAEKTESWQKLTATYPALRKPYLLYVGQIQPRKNLLRLIEAFELLKKDQPELQLVLAGSHGWLQAPILERIKKSEQTHHIFLTGRISDEFLSALYWHANVFVLPSLYEGFGMPILEAMASGSPVVTSNASSMPEIVGDAAVLVDPNDTDSLAAGIEEAQSNSRDMAQQGVAQAKNFSWEKTARATLKLLY